MSDIHRPLRAMLAACVIAAVSGQRWARCRTNHPGVRTSVPLLSIVAGSGNNNGDAHLRAGIEIKMQPGWKTYWRYPGDSGVPPAFDFSGSENLKTATVLYPAPHLFTDETGQSLGYKDAVIFPLVDFAAAGWQTGSASPESRLRGLRKIVRAG